MIYYFRNRLENNTEHWNTLLLSLRELVEWVIKKDTEISSFGPLGNDLISLQKQQVSSKFIFCLKKIKTLLVVTKYKIHFRTIIEDSGGNWKRKDQLLIQTYAAVANT